MLRLLFFFALALASPWAFPLWAQTATGIAGVSDGAAGRKTASGEAYDPGAFTAAVDNLRFGIRLAVTNPATGRTVTVRVNDDGPGAGRLLDLSKTAAEALGITDPAPVKLRVLLAEEKDVTSVDVPPAPSPVPEPAAFVPTPEALTYFQLGAFRTVFNAQTLARALVKQGYEPRVRKDGSLYRVYLSVPEAEAQAVSEGLAKAGRNGFLQVSKEPGGTLLKLTTE